MKRRGFLTLLSGFAAAVCWPARSEQAEPVARLKKTAAEWRSLLPADRYRVLFEEDTERPFSSPLNAEKHEGKFVCAACFLPLFDSTRKFESGTGWPSFWTPLDEAVGTKADRSHFMTRTEVHCVRCGGHLGHVFPDGPRPTGLRYCMNGLALDFDPEDDE